MIDRETVDRIFAAANIVDVVSDFITLKKRGTNYMACCPFHNEKTPSFVSLQLKGSSNVSAVAKAVMLSPLSWNTKT